MNTNTSSSAPLNGHAVAPGAGTRWLPFTLPFLRRARPKADAPAPATDHRAIDSVGYHPDGAYAHGLSTSGRTRCSVGDSEHIPVPAFGMPEAEIGALTRQARKAAFTERPVEEITTFAGQLFDSRYGSIRVRHEERVAAGERVAANTLAECARLDTAASGAELMVRDETKTLSLPRDIRLVGFFALLLVWLGVAASEWSLAASKLFAASADKFTAYSVTVTLAALSILIEWLLIRARTTRPGLMQVWRGVSLLGAVALIVAFAYRHGAGAGAEELHATVNLAADPAGLPVPSFAADRLLYALQLFAGIVVGAALLEWMLALLVNREATVLNPAREKLLAHARELRRSLNDEAAAVAKSRGHLTEYQACRASFVTEAIQAYHLALSEIRLLKEESELLARRRRALEG